MTPPARSVLVLYNEPAGPDGAWHESDAGVLDQVRAVTNALDRLGLAHRVASVRRLTDIPGLLARSGEDVVFNLVEGFPGAPGDMPLVPAVIRAAGKGFTGNDTESLALTSDKWRAKAVLQAADLPCPPGALVAVGCDVDPAQLPPGPHIVKPVAADASEGIDASSVIDRPGDALHEAVRRIHRLFKQPALVEQVVGTRELNVSLLQRGREVNVLAVAEIDFSAFAPGKPRIVDYTAKWIKDSFEYNHTPRLLPAPVPDALAEWAKQLALEAWYACACRDYVRVDLRLDDAGQLYIIEVNANPDISPDDGFPAAVEYAGITYHEFIRILIDNASPPRATRRRRMRERVSSPADPGLEIRRSHLADRDAVIALLDATKFFRPDELEVAREVLDEALACGPDGHYQSYSALDAGRLVGWVCFGPTPCTIGTYDIYWLAVAPSHQSKGIGRKLMAHAENLIRTLGGRLAVVETAGRDQYLPTRRFYEKIGYSKSADLPDFYAPGDPKIVYTKQLA